MSWSGERLETYVYNQNTHEHLHRYAIALNYAKDKKVLDIACGTGYGSNFLAKYASQVIGIDIDKNSIIKAQQKYKAKNLSYQQGSILEIPIESNSIDLVVCFETLEHLKEHDILVSEVKRVMKDDGILIISSPDKYYYSDLPNFVNPHHLRELTDKEFKELVQSNFQFSFFLKQTSGYYSLIFPENGMFIQTQSEGDYDYLNLSQKINPLYWIAVCSSQRLPEVIFDGLFEANYLINHYKQQAIVDISNSREFKLGYFIFHPWILFSKLRSFLKI